MNELKDDKGRTEEEFLANYKARNYEKPSTTVDTIIFSREPVLKVLLIKRKNHPFLNCWAFPGGFVNMDEDIDIAAYRELKEETSVCDVYLKQLHTYGEVHRDPRMRVISIAYVAILDYPLYANAQDDAKEALWFHIEKKDQQLHLYDDLKKYHLFYDILETGLKRIEGYESLAFDHNQMLYDALHYLDSFQYCIDK